MSDYEQYLLQLQAERKPSINDMTLDERMTEYIEWQNSDFDRDIMVDAHLEIIRLRAALETAADELSKRTNELREARGVDFNAVTRIEIIDKVGRVYTAWNSVVTTSVQDDGRTLKLFVMDRAAD